MVVVIGHVFCLFDRILLYTFGPAARFFFEFEPLVYIIFKQPFLLLWEVLHLMDMENFVAFFHSFDQFRCAPSSCNLALLRGVAAHVASFEHGFSHFFFHTTSAERDGELVVLA